MKYIYLIVIAFLFAACNNVGNFQKEVDHYLVAYNEQMVALYTVSAEAEWASNTKIMEGDTLNAYHTRMANEAFAAFTGSAENIEKATKFLEREKDLTDLQKRQLRAILYAAANNPAIVADLVKERIKAETLQNEQLFGFDFQLDGKSVSTNAIDEILRSETSLKKRLAAWEASKEVGKSLKGGLFELRDLRNKTVQALGYDNYFAYQVSDYGMSTQEMMDLNKKLIADVWPLYRELHTYMRYSLADKYNQAVPEKLPAHWLPNRWGQDWSSEIEVEGLDLDSVLKEKGSEWLVKQAERFYVSLGLEALPEVFYTKSSLYPLPADANYKKNNHASAWHMDLNRDVRSLMSVEPNGEWYETTHHELGHIYYYLEYTNPDVPPLLRGGANRAFHEGVGSLMGLAAMQQPFLAGLGLVDDAPLSEEAQIKNLLKEALNYVVFIPFSSGTMTHFEEGLYSGSIHADNQNAAWWSLVEKYQGISTPNMRGEEYCDASSKTHINNDAAQYYDYALSFVLLFQLHDHIAKNILKQDPRATNYYGNKEVGVFLHNLLYPGASRDWRELLKETTGEDMNAKAMLSYFEPLMKWLKEENKGRVHTLGDGI